MLSLTNLKDRSVVDATTLHFVSSQGEASEALELSLEFDDGGWVTFRPASDGISLSLLPGQSDEIDMQDEGQIVLQTDSIFKLEGSRVTDVEAYFEQQSMVAVKLTFDNLKDLFIMNNGDQLVLSDTDDLPFVTSELVRRMV